MVLQNIANQRNWSQTKNQWTNFGVNAGIQVASSALSIGASGAGGAVSGALGGASGAFVGSLTQASINTFGNYGITLGTSAITTAVGNIGLSAGDQNKNWNNFGKGAMVGAISSNFSMLGSMAGAGISAGVNNPYLSTFLTTMSSTAFEEMGYWAGTMVSNSWDGNKIDYNMVSQTAQNRYNAGWGINIGTNLASSMVSTAVTSAFTKANQDRLVATGNYYKDGNYIYDKKTGKQIDDGIMYKSLLSTGISSTFNTLGSLITGAVTNNFSNIGHSIYNMFDPVNAYNSTMTGAMNDGMNRMGYEAGLENKLNWIVNFGNQHGFEGKENIKYGYTQGGAESIGNDVLVSRAFVAGLSRNLDGAVHGSSILNVWESIRDGKVDGNNLTETLEAAKAKLAYIELMEEKYGKDFTSSNPEIIMLKVARGLGDQAFSNFVEQLYDSSGDYWRLISRDDGSLYAVWDGLTAVTDEFGNTLYDDGTYEGGLEIIFGNAYNSLMSKLSNSGVDGDWNNIEKFALDVGNNHVLSKWRVVGLYDIDKRIQSYNSDFENLSDHEKSNYGDIKEYYQFREIVRSYEKMVFASKVDSAISKVLSPLKPILDFAGWIDQMPENAGINNILGMSGMGASDYFAAYYGAQGPALYGAEMANLSAAINYANISANAKMSGILSRIAATKTFNPLNKGPLADDIIQTFRSGTYRQVTTTKPTTLYRVIGPGGRVDGSYWTRVKPSGPVQSIIDSALDQQWGNIATHQVRMTVPAGTTFYEGFAATQRGLVGGGNQIFIPKVDPSWINGIVGF